MFEKLQLLLARGRVAAEFPEPSSCRGRVPELPRELLLLSSLFWELLLLSPWLWELLLLSSLFWELLLLSSLPWELLPLPEQPSQAAEPAARAGMCLAVPRSRDPW